MKKVWNEIKEEIHQISPRMANSLNKPASESDIKDMEKVLSQELPSSVKEYFLTFNGQNHEGFNIPLIGDNSLLSIEEVLETWKLQLDLFSEEEEIDFIVENKVKPTLWDKGWIPLSDSMSGTRIILDLNPGKYGTMGQVFQLWPGRDMEEDEIVIADSFAEFSQEVLKRLREKMFEFCDDIIEFDGDWIV
ncbi:MAG: SMI1/KNR4 family protein [Dysgonomonas sp.]|nr:SMI1/KNR4 family protein [Dysgonomonas sp.]